MVHVFSKSILAAALALALLAPLARAQSKDDAGANRGLYLDIGGGYALLRDSELTDDAVPGLVGRLEADGGFDLTLAIGAPVWRDLRLEVEGAFRRNDVRTVDLTFAGVPLGALPLSGDVSSGAALVNVWYDLPVGGEVRPYLGAGLGYGLVEADIGIPGFVPQDSMQDGGLAWQVGAGMVVRLARSVGLRLGYKYFNIEGLDFSGTEADYRVHTFEAALVLRLR